MKFRTLGAWIVLGLWLAAPARASQWIPRTLPELAAGADLIVVGRCEAVSCRWNADRTLIFTANRFRVLRALKGAPGETITLEELGGTVGSVGLEVAGVPRFAVGEEVLLFVRRTELGRWETFGAAQGKFRILRDRQGRPRVQSDIYRAELAAMTPPERRGHGAPLDLFATRLIAAAARMERLR